MIQDYLRRLFENDKLRIVGRLKKTDLVELNNGDDFLGIVSADDPAGKTFTLQMAILDSIRIVEALSFCAGKSLDSRKPAAL